MSQYIITYTKKKFYPLDPDISMICIEDIAHALSMLCRANGHYPRFYSVAQHSIDCAGEAAARMLPPKLILACLLHDGSEAYLSDITRPVKSQLGNYKKYEKALENCILKKYTGELDEEERRLVKEIDDTLLYYEFYSITNEEICEKKPLFSAPEFRTEAFENVEKRFLQLFEKYSKSF